MENYHTPLQNFSVTQRDISRLALLTGFCVTFHELALNLEKMLLTSGYIYIATFWFKNEYLLLRLHLSFPLLWCFRAPKPETFENTSDALLVWNLQGCVAVATAANGDLWQHRHGRQRFAA